MAQTKSRRRLDAVFQDLFVKEKEETKKENEEAKKLFAYLQRILYQFGIYKAYQPKDILAEVYARAVRFIERGGEIRLPLPWIRRTAYHIVRELKREMVRVADPDLEREPVWQGENSITGLMFREDWKAMQNAFEKLEVSEQNLLRCRVIRGLKWSEVNDCLVEFGEPRQSEHVLRQRGCRVLKKLRKIYEQDRDTSLIDFDEVLDDDSRYF
jgi:DNA-directed RNA polymerase specialized sigma24 family protein